MKLARALQLRPAIIAGRARYEKKNYRLLSRFVGAGGMSPQILNEPRKVGRV